MVTCQIQEIQRINSLVIAVRTISHVLHSGYILVDIDFRLCGLYRNTSSAVSVLVHEMLIGDRHPDHGMDLDKAVASCDQRRPIILLAHQPQAAKEALDSSYNIQLVLSGNVICTLFGILTYSIRHPLEIKAKSCLLQPCGQNMIDLSTGLESDFHQQFCCIVC